MIQGHCQSLAEKKKILVIHENVLYAELGYPYLRFDTLFRSSWTLMGRLMSLFIPMDVYMCRVVILKHQCCPQWILHSWNQLYSLNLSVYWSDLTFFYCICPSSILGSLVTGSCSLIIIVLIEWSYSINGSCLWFCIALCFALWMFLTVLFS